MQNSDLITQLRSHVRRFGVIFTKHSIDKMGERNITTDEVRDTILVGEIIEMYPAHPYGSCCLVQGQTEAGRHLHVVCSLPPRVRIITTYEPNPDEWTDYRVRR